MTDAYEHSARATARALLVQDAATAIVAALDARRDLMTVHDGAMALGLAVATHAMACAGGEGGPTTQQLLAMVLGVAQSAVRAVEEERTS